MYVRNFVGVPTWLEGIILDQIGPVSFQVRLADGRILKRHVDHVRIRYPKENAMPSVPIVVEGPSVSHPNGTTQLSEETVHTNIPIVSSPQRHDPVLPPWDQEGSDGLLIDYVEHLKGGKYVVS